MVLMRVYAKVGNLILSTAIARFNGTDNIASGQVFEDVGHFYNLDALDSFESSAVDSSNLNCEYFKRS